MTEPAAPFRWDDFEALPAARVLRRGGAEVALEPKAFDLLVYLIENRDRVVTKDELLDRLWAGRVVLEASVSQCLSKIRRVIDVDRATSAIRTVRGHGFRFVAEVQAGLPPTPAMPGFDSRRPGLLVLPFRRLSSNTGDDYIAESVTELLIATLSSVRELRVISRTSAMALARSDRTLPEMAAQVQARWVVEGSVRVAEDAIQVVAQLIDADTDDHVWAATYGRELNDLMAIENEVTRQIARHVRGNLPLTAGLPELAGSALRLYLHGRALIGRRDVASLRLARQHLKTVTTDEPDFAPAWASLAEVLILLAHYGGLTAATAATEARAAVDEALRRDPGQPIGRACLGALMFFFDRDPEAAEQETHKALRIQPNQNAMMMMANIRAVQRRFAEVRVWCRHALEVDPFNVGVNMNVADHLVLMGAAQEAVEQLRETLKLAPDHVPSRVRCAWALALVGDSAAADGILEELRAQHMHTAAYREYAAIVSGLNGNRETAQRWFEALQQGSEFATPWSLARAAAHAGQVESALSCLATALEQRSSSAPFLAVTPAFVSLHDHPRWPELIAAL